MVPLRTGNASGRGVVAHPILAMTKPAAKPTPAVAQAMDRRRFIQRLGAGASLLAFGGVYTIADDGLIATARACPRVSG